MKNIKELTTSPATILAAACVVSLPLILDLKNLQGIIDIYS
jgi:hypothetical protein